MEADICSLGVSLTWGKGIFISVQMLIWTKGNLSNRLSLEVFLLLKLLRSKHLGENIYQQNRLLFPAVWMLTVVSAHLVRGVPCSPNTFPQNESDSEPMWNIQLALHQWPHTFICLSLIHSFKKTTKEYSPTSYRAPMRRYFPYGHMAGKSQTLEGLSQPKSLGVGLEPAGAVGGC